MITVAQTCGYRNNIVVYVNDDKYFMLTAPTAPNSCFRAVVYEHAYIERCLQINVNYEFANVRAFDQFVFLAYVLTQISGASFCYLVYRYSKHEHMLDQSHYLC